MRPKLAFAACLCFGCLLLASAVWFAKRLQVEPPTSKQSGVAQAESARKWKKIERPRRTWPEGAMPTSIIGHGVAALNAPCYAQIAALWSEPPVATIGLGGRMHTYADYWYYEIE